MLEVGTKRQVYNSKAYRTKGGLTKSDLIRKKKGKGYRFQYGRKISVYSIVSKHQHKNGLNNRWASAVREARHQLNIKGFVSLSKDGMLYQTAKRIYETRSTPSQKEISLVGQN